MSRIFKPVDYRDKHAPGGWGSKIDISDADAQKLLNDSANCFLDGKTCVGTKNKKFYAFKDDNAGTWHGYRITGHEVYTKYAGAAKKIAEVLGISPKALVKYP